MVKELKARNEKALVDFFKETLGEDYAISAVWGLPVVKVTVEVKNEIETVRWVFNFNTEDQNYDISTFASKIVDGKEAPSTANINRDIIGFILGNILRITEESLTPDNTAKKADPAKEA